MISGFKENRFIDGNQTTNILDLNKASDLFSIQQSSIMSQSPSLLYQKTTSSTENPIVLSKARKLLAEKKTALSTEMRDKYRTALERYRRRFLSGYVTMFRPPGFGDYPSRETLQLKRESVKMYTGLIKQKEGRIGLNVR